MPCHSTQPLMSRAAHRVMLVASRSDGRRVVAHRGVHRLARCVRSLEGMDVFIPGSCLLPHTCPCVPEPGRTEYCGTSEYIPCSIRDLDNGQLVFCRSLAESVTDSLSECIQGLSFMGVTGFRD